MCVVGGAPVEVLAETTGAANCLESARPAGLIGH